MKALLIFIFLLMILILSCEKNSNEPDYPFEAEVLTKNFDCKEFEIKILNDLDRIKDLFGKSVLDSIYIAGNLPEDLKISGLKIVFNVDGPITGDTFSACTMMGPTLNWIWITKAKSK